MRRQRILTENGICARGDLLVVVEVNYQDTCRKDAACFFKQAWPSECIEGSAVSANFKASEPCPVGDLVTIQTTLVSL
jgi:hypothetical protein